MTAKSSLILCDACGEGHLHPKTEWDEVEYKGKHGKIHHVYSICDVCGSELANAKQTLENKRAWIRFRKQVDNIPLGTAIAEMRKRFGLNQVEAGQLFGGGPVAFSKYEHDDIIPDEAMSNLLYLAIHHPSTVYRLAARKGFHLPLSAHINIKKTMEWLEPELQKGEQFQSQPFEFGLINIAELSMQSYQKKKPASSTLPSTSVMTHFGNGEQAGTLQ